MIEQPQCDEHLQNVPLVGLAQNGRFPKVIKRYSLRFHEVPRKCFVIEMALELCFIPYPYFQ